MTSVRTTALIPEWAEQSSVFLAWPCPEGDFARWLPEVEETYIRIAGEIALRQTVIIACRDSAHQSHVNARMSVFPGIDGHVRTVVIPYNDVWVRDSAPLSVLSDEGPRLLDFRFNGWGGKYECADDARLARNLHATGVLGNVPLDPVDFVLEGGSIETDGQGSLLTTSRCLLNPNRNPELGREQIEDCLRQRLGARRVLWVDHGHAEGDDTDAHVDTLARFCSPDTIAYTVCDQPDDPLYAGFRAMAEQLAGFTAPGGQPYRLVPLPVPAPILSEEGDRLPATYANFLIINGAVLVPVYGDPADEVALSRLADCFPDREIVAIDCLPLIRQYGSLHCMTMQFPMLIAQA